MENEYKFPELPAHLRPTLVSLTSLMMKAALKRNDVALLQLARSLIDSMQEYEQAGNES